MLTSPDLAAWRERSIALIKRQDVIELMDKVTPRAPGRSAAAVRPTSASCSAGAWNGSMSRPRPVMACEDRRRPRRATVG